MASELTVQTIKGPTSGGNANKILIGSGQDLIAPGHVIGYSQSPYTSTSTYSSSSELTIDSPLDGTYSYTTKSANSLLRIHAHFAPIRHYVTWEFHALRMFYSTSGSGGSYTQFYTGSQGNYTESYNVMATNVDCIGHINITHAAGAVFNFKITVQGHTNGNTFAPNQINLGSGTAGSPTTAVGSFISCTEIAQ